MKKQPSIPVSSVRDGSRNIQGDVKKLNKPSQFKPKEEEERKFIENENQN